MAASHGTVKAPYGSRPSRSRCGRFLLREGPVDQDLANCPGDPGYARFDPTINPPSLTVGEKTAWWERLAASCRDLAEPESHGETERTPLERRRPGGCAQTRGSRDDPVPAGSPVRLVTHRREERRNRRRPIWDPRGATSYFSCREMHSPRVGKTARHHAGLRAEDRGRDAHRHTRQDQLGSTAWRNPPIPVTVAPGYYRSLFYADGPRTVSELTEKDNWAVSDEFQTVPPYFSGIPGPVLAVRPEPDLQRKAGNNAVPLAYQFTYDNVTASTPAPENPVMRFLHFRPQHPACRGRAEQRVIRNRLAVLRRLMPARGHDLLRAPAYTWQ